MTHGIALRTFVLLLIGLGSATAAESMKAGLARMKITPDGPIWMSGYGNRNRPSEGVVHDLWAKAVAFQDAKGTRVVIVTTDLIGLPRPLAEAVAAEALKRYGIERSGLLLNSSHTHTGPIVMGNLQTMFDFTPEDAGRVRNYGTLLRTTLVDVIGAALGDLKPAKLSHGKGTAGFAVNRRQFTPQGVRIGVNPQGAVDHDVPVVAVHAPDGKLRGVLYGYACHNTTLTGEFYKLSGDYAGFSQIELEKSNPGAQAMFVMLCGGDQNPNPRSQEALAIEHGRTLAGAVDSVLKSTMQPVSGNFRSAFQVVALRFAHRTRDDFEKELTDKVAAKARRAKAMIEAMDQRRPVRTVQFPVQAIRFGKSLTMVALGGETVVGYGLRTKREFPKEATIVAGYSNDVMCYIPTRKIVEEGGYEAVDSMMYYGQPGPFDADVEETIFETIRKVMKRVGRSE